jgi:hypothetical protein
MSFQPTLRAALPLLLLSAGLAGCGGDAPPATDAGRPTDAFAPAVDAFIEPGTDAFVVPVDAFAPPVDAFAPPATVSRRDDVVPILNGSCMSPGCHSNPSLFLSLTATTGCSAAAERRMIVPGSPDTSYLIAKLEGTASCGRQMPLSRPPLSAGQIGTIRTWIAEGAQDN